MSKYDKLLAKARRNPKGFRFDELLALLRASGFVKQESPGSSHQKWSHPDISDAMVKSLIVQPAKDGSAHPYQVKKLLEVIDDYLS